MDCPRCRTPLDEGTYAGAREDVPMRLCRTCSGSMMRQPDLPNVLDRLSVDLYGSVGPNVALPGVPDEHPPTDCPDCAAPMERYGYMGSRQVMIDGCQRCGWVWFDPEELMAVARMYVRLGRQEETFQVPYRPADIVGTQLTTTLVERALLAGMALG